MKKLTTEQKAQRYDEAIERYKAKQEYESQKVHEFIEYLFPELKESEGEKIRKSLLDYLYTLPNHFSHNGGLVTDWIAWLEKQGNLMKALQISNARIGELIEENYYLREQLEKQGEQKSQGKSALEAAKEEKVDNQNCVKPVDKVEPIIVRDFNSVFSREQVEEIDKRIEESQRLYNAELRDAMRKVEDFPMTN